MATRVLSFQERKAKIRKPIKKGVVPAYRQAGMSTLSIGRQTIGRKIYVHN